MGVEKVEISDNQIWELNSLVSNVYSCVLCFPHLVSPLLLKNFKCHPDLGLKIQYFVISHISFDETKISFGHSYLYLITYHSQKLKKRQETRCVISGTSDSFCGGGKEAPFFHVFFFMLFAFQTRMSRDVGKK